MTGVIDYGMGNLRSVLNAIEYVGCPGTLVETPDQLAACDRLILPGVGAFAKAMNNLEERGLVGTIRAHASDRKPLLGICLGMEILATTGDEPHPCGGLDLISGEVRRLPVKPTTPLPHVGWNDIQLLRDHPVFAGVRRDVDFYFVHSYGFRPTTDDSSVLAVMEYDVPVPAAIAAGSVLGLQFHPEKSQTAGLRLLEQFCRWDGVC